MRSYIPANVRILLPVTFGILLPAGLQGQTPPTRPFRLSTNSEIATEHFRRGFREAVETRFSRATVQLEQALAADSSLAVARALYARVKPGTTPEWRNQQIQRAMRDVANASTEEVLFAVAWRDQTRGHLPRSLASWRALLELVPNDSALHSAMPLLLSWAGREKEAFASAEELVRRFPEYGPAYGQLAYRKWVVQRDTAAALAAYQEYVRRAPDDPNAHRVLAFFLGEELGRHTEAAAHYRRTVQLDSTYSYGWFGLANAALHRGRADSADVFMARLVRNEPLEEERLRFATYRAYLRAFRGDAAGSVHDLARLAEQHASRGLAVDAAKILTAAAAVDAAQGKGRRTDSLLVAARAAPAPGPANPGSLMLEGVAEALRGRSQRARAVAATLDSIAVRPGQPGASPEARLIRGVALISEKRFAEAQAELSGLEEQYNPLVRAAKALALAGVGQRREALAMRDSLLKDTRAGGTSPLPVVARAMVSRVR